MAAPVEPMVIAASACPALTAPTATAIDALGFCRSARMGESSSWMTPSDGTTLTGRPAPPQRSSSGWTASGVPTSSTWTPPALAASTAPWTTSVGA